MKDQNPQNRYHQPAPKWNWDNPNPQYYPFARTSPTAQTPGLHRRGLSDLFRFHAVDMSRFAVDHVMVLKSAYAKQTLGGPDGWAVGTYLGDVVVNVFTGWAQIAGKRVSLDFKMREFS